MTPLAGRTELFRREAAERLRELITALSAATAPDLHAVQRAARGLRGIATLAGPVAYAEAAQRLEAAILRLADGMLRWDTAAPVLRDALRELTALAGLAASWSIRQDQDAAAVAAELGHLLDDRPVVEVATLAPEDSPRPPAAEPGVLPIVPIESLAPDGAPPAERPIVPIATLAPDEVILPPPALPPVPVAGPAPAGERTRLEQALSRYSRLVAANTPAPLFEGPIPPAVPPMRQAAEVAPAAAAGPVIVPIETLLYRGPAALARATEVREELERTLRSASATLTGVEPLVRELLDLVPLALEQEP